MSGLFGAVRRHWLTGALLCGVAGLMAYTGTHLYHTEMRLRDVRLARMELEEQLREETLRNQTLQAKLTQMTSDAYMEVLAKEMGYIFPNETVYQQGSEQGK